MLRLSAAVPAAVEAGLPCLTAGASATYAVEAVALGQAAVADSAGAIECQIIMVPIHCRTGWLQTGAVSVCERLMSITAASFARVLRDCKANS